MSFSSLPNTKDKLICAVLYTGMFVPLMTFVPIIYIVVSNLRKFYLKDFIKYHCYQAILFNMLMFFLPQLFSLVINFLSTLLSLLVIFDNSILILKSCTDWLINTYFIFIKVVAVYAIIWTARGRFTYMPPISQAVNLLLR